MATDAVGNSSTTSSLLDQLNAGLNASTAKETTKKNELGKDAFLKMLVEQLKNQDPTEPIKNEDLAVNLAQFSQVEQLVEINGKLGSSGISDSASLAAYLGREVLVEGDSADVVGGNGGSVYFELSSAAQSGSLQLLDANGQVVEERELGPLASGRQMLDLSDLNLPDGSYKVKVNLVGLNGESSSPGLSTGGVVTGFIPGADPSLLIGDKEVKATEIKLVTTPSV